ncbi:MAG: dihydropteroate synthase [Alphaproteobacteria bacterium]
MKWKEYPGWGRKTLVMGILNATPDSFSGDGLISEHTTLERALAAARSQCEAGADILDVGGESTRPGADTVDAATEKARILPLITEIRAAIPDILISADTYRADVAEAALDAGADIVNDVWALRADPDMAPMLAERNAAVVLMHNRSRPNDILSDGRLGTEYVGADYPHVIEDVSRALIQCVEEALDAGIDWGKIAVDPGIGFGKTVTQNLALLGHLRRLKSHVGLPVLIGPSRKSFVGRVLDTPVEDRLEGTAAAVASGVMNGADIVRVHDVREMARVVRMIDAVKSAPADGKESPE